VRDVLLFVAAFLACAVEMVEALTIVLAVGVTRGWRSTFAGVGAAAATLALAVAVLGPALTAIPIDGLRLVVGGLLLVFGLQWLRKAILRASGFKARHDEEVAFSREREAAQQAGPSLLGGMDWYSFTVAFKGVLLEGLEVVFIVLTFGAGQRHVGLAAAAAGLAGVAVVTAGVLVHAPLRRVPENAMKLMVGTMLTTFGMFWGAEGAGVHWPGGDASILGLLAFVALGSALLIGGLRHRHARMAAPPGADSVATS
jgi:uncharacterized membrane protein